MVNFFKFLKKSLGFMGFMGFIGFTSFMGLDKWEILYTFYKYNFY